MIHLKSSITSSRAFNVAIVIPSKQVSDNRLNPANLSSSKTPVIRNMPPLPASTESMVLRNQALSVPPQWGVEFDAV
jgi:hypothetical protein